MCPPPFTTAETTKLHPFPHRDVCDYILTNLFKNIQGGDEIQHLASTEGQSFGLKHSCSHWCTEASPVCRQPELRARGSFQSLTFTPRLPSSRPFLPPLLRPVNDKDERRGPVGSRQRAPGQWDGLAQPNVRWRPITDAADGSLAKRILLQRPHSQILPEASAGTLLTAFRSN